MTRKLSKFAESLRDRKITDLTHREWYWWALACKSKWPDVCIATVKQTCVCKCGHKHTKDVRVRIHGSHERAVQVASTLFDIGRPGVPPDLIEKIEVKGPDTLWTPIYRTDEGEPRVGFTMRLGTMEEVSRDMRKWVDQHPEK